MICELKEHVRRHSSQFTRVGFQKFRPPSLDRAPKWSSVCNAFHNRSDRQTPPAEATGVHWTASLTSNFLYQADDLAPQMGIFDPYESRDET